jgi:hypothetical protein
VTALFLILVVLIFLTSVRLWLRILRGQQPAQLHEDPYQRVTDSPLAPAKS